MKWDFFVSHASEDKDEIARPLADELLRAGYRVWFDEFRLNIGDSLRERIDEGLAESHFGIVILSPEFLVKKWPKAELDGLFARDDSQAPRLLPVWHNLTADALSRYSPLLTARLAISSAKGISAVREAVVRSASASGLAVPYAHLESLINESRVPAVSAFLQSHPMIIGNHNMSWDKLFVQPVLEDWTGRTPEFVFSVFGRSLCCTSLRYIQLAPIDPDELKTATAALLTNARALIKYSFEMAPKGCYEAMTAVDVYIVGGRRADEFPYRPSELDPTIRVHSYDWLLDGARRHRDSVMPQDPPIRIIGPGFRTTVGGLFNPQYMGNPV